MLRLFHFPASCSVASHLVLEESGADYEAVQVDLGAAAQTQPAYLAVNPKGRVPALQTDAGVLSETPAIIAFVAQLFPAAELAPTDAFEFARMQAFNSYLSSTVHVAHAHRVRGYRWADDPIAIADMKRKTPETMAACFALIETQLLGQPWVLGERYSVSDPYLFTITRWMPAHGLLLADYPKLQAHHERMRARPAVQRVLASYGQH